MATLPNTLASYTDRAELERAATELIAANDNEPKKGREPVYRGTWPAINWARKHDEVGAAALWLAVKLRLGDFPANDNEPQPEGFGLDKRKNGTARGKSKPKQDLGAYLSLPGYIGRLGEEPREQIVGREVREATFGPKEQLPLFTFDELENTRWGFCAPAVAKGAYFLGAAGGLGQPKPRKSRGDVREVDCRFDLPKPSLEIDYIIELIAARSTLQDIGAALDYTGRYRTKAGANAVLAAMEWAKKTTDIEGYITNRVA